MPLQLNRTLLFQASVDDINNAFRRLSRIYHPDKHAGSPQKSKDAQELFTKLKKAHEGILSLSKQTHTSCRSSQLLEANLWLSLYHRVLLQFFLIHTPKRFMTQWGWKDWRRRVGRWVFGGVTKNLFIYFFFFCEFVLSFFLQATKKILGSRYVCNESLFWRSLLEPRHHKKSLKNTNDFNKNEKKEDFEMWQIPGWDFFYSFVMDAMRYTPSTPRHDPSPGRQPNDCQFPQCDITLEGEHCSDWLIFFCFYRVLLQWTLMRQTCLIVTRELSHQKMSGRFHTFFFFLREIRKWRFVHVNLEFSSLLLGFVSRLFPACFGGTSNHFGWHKNHHKFQDEKERSELSRTDYDSQLVVAWQSKVSCGWVQWLVQLSSIFSEGRCYSFLGFTSQSLKSQTWQSHKQWTLLSPRKIPSNYLAS